MVNNCCVVGCTNYVGKKPGLRFYSFPSDAQRREKWVAAVRRKDWQPSKHTRICNEHFINGKQISQYILILPTDLAIYDCNVRVEISLASRWRLMLLVYLNRYPCQYL